MAPPTPDNAASATPVAYIWPDEIATLRNGQSVSAYLTPVEEWQSSCTAPLFDAATVTALEAEVAENEGVIAVWRRRCEEAERRVAELEGELRSLYHAYVSTLESGRDRIIDLGGKCDPLEVMERNDPALICAKRALTGAGAK